MTASVTASATTSGSGCTASQQHSLVYQLATHVLANDYTGQAVENGRAVNHFNITAALCSWFFTLCTQPERQYQEVEQGVTMCFSLASTWYLKLEELQQKDCPCLKLNIVVRV